jgi:Sec-independent protein translocase protein TatA
MEILWGLLFWFVVLAVILAVLGASLEALGNGWRLAAKSIGEFRRGLAGK